MARPTSELHEDAPAYRVSRPQSESRTPCFLDLFCGCGGFSLGLQRAGFQPLAAIDFNEEAIQTYRANFPGVLALRKDLTRFTPDKLAARLNTNQVDVIVGGPPCQGFSTVRQVDAANHGSRVRRDKRRYLFRPFLDYISAFRPKVFVVENVPGIRSAAKGKFFTLVQAEARRRGYRVHAQVEESWKLGVPQKRRRQLIIGVRNDVPGYFPTELEPAARAVAQVANLPYRRMASGAASGQARATPPAGGLTIRDTADCQSAPPTLWDAIGDLPPLNAGEGDEQRK